MGLAGSLSISDIPRFAKINPDYLGFRGALCHNSARKNGLDYSNLVRSLEVLRKCNSLI
jgi:(5-formylfuran-3-yl)methyl phosphate synthase